MTESELVPETRNTYQDEMKDRISKMTSVPANYYTNFFLSPSSSELAGFIGLGRPGGGHPLPPYGDQLAGLLIAHHHHRGRQLPLPAHHSPLHLHLRLRPELAVSVVLAPEFGGGEKMEG